MINRNVLYLTYDGLTDPLGQSQILPYVIGLSKCGYKFTIISFEKKLRFKSANQKIKILCSENEIEWVPLLYHKTPPVFSTLYDLLNLWREVKRIQKIKSHAIIHCRSYITSLIGLRAKRKWGTKFIFDMRGFWADERVEGGLWNIRNPIYKIVYVFFKRKEHQFVIESDQIVSLTWNGKKEIESWKISEVPIAVIPTCVDVELFDPLKISEVDQSQLRHSLGIRKNDFVLLYVGSWGTWYQTKEMLDFFSQLKQGNPSAKFLILSSDKINLESYAWVDDVIQTDAPRSSVPLYISLATLAVCLIKTSFSKKASSATKIGEIMAMNIPIAINDGWGDVADLMEALPNTVFNVESFEPRNFKHQAAQSRPYCINHLSLEIGISSYFKIYESVMV